MKFCPVCRQKYDDAQNFCLDDGMALEVFFAEAQVETATFKNESAINQTSPTILSSKQTPPSNQDTITDVNPPIFISQSVPPPKSNALQIALLSILGTLGVVGIAAGAWWLGNRQAANEIAANTSTNSIQKPSPKANDSSSLPTPNKTEIAQSNQKSSGESNTNLTAPTNSKSENTSATPSPTASENSTVDVQVRLTNLGKYGNSPYPGGKIVIQTDGKILDAVTNNAGIAAFKSVPCGKPVRFSVHCEDGLGVFPRNLKCGANASWSYQVNCFVEGKTGGCAVEQLK